MVNKAWIISHSNVVNFDIFIRWELYSALLFLVIYKMFLLLLTFIFISEIAFHEEVEYFISPSTHQTSRCRVSYSIDSVFDPLGSGIISLNVITYTIFSLLNTLSLRNHFHNIAYNDMKTEDASYII